MARDDPSIHLRIPPWLKTIIDRQAAANERSLNSEILFRLRQAYNVQDDPARSVRKPAGHRPNSD